MMWARPKHGTVADPWPGSLPQRLLQTAEILEASKITCDHRVSQSEITSQTTP
eukprot:COSAG02_NODE_31998_length_523_cov_21.099057_1_plen_52_part_10